MTLLPDHMIESYVTSPIAADQLQPASIDLTLGDSFAWPIFYEPARLVDLTERTNIEWERYEVLPGDGLVIAPGEFMLGTTVETVRLPGNVSGRVEGKSSIGRCGLLVHTTAGFIDPGFEGQITLELVNLSPVPYLLTPGMRIAQICFYSMAGNSQRQYGSPGLGSHYQGQRGATIPQ